MRVLVWTEAFWPLIGGVEVASSQLLTALRDRGHVLLVITPQDGVSETYGSFRGIPVHRFRFWDGLRQGADVVLDVRARVAALKREFAPDVVHVHALGSSVFFQLRTRRVCAAPMIVTLHGGWGITALRASPVENSSVRCESLLAQSLRAANWVVGVSAAVLDEARALMPEIAGRSSVIHNGLASPAEAPAALPFDPPHLVCVARLAREKGVDVALDALASIVRRCPGTRLTIAGDGPLRAELEQQAARLGLAPAVDFIGWVAPRDVAAVFERATVVLVPSRREAFGLVALEAALYGRPVVGSRVDGLPEVVVAGQTGVLVEPDRSADFAAAVVALLSAPERAIALGRAARQWARDQFGLDRCADAYEQLYGHVMKEERNARVARAVLSQ